MSLELSGTEVLQVLDELGKDWEEVLPRNADDQSLWDTLQAARRRVDRAFDSGNEPGRIQATDEIDSANRELRRRIEATNWIVSFQAAG